MLRLAVVTVSLAQAQGVATEEPPFHGHKSSKQWLPRKHVGPAPAAEMLVAEEALPASFDWRNVNGQNLVTSDWNQHIPQYCGGCWIHGTLSALNDRIKVMRRGQFPDVRLGRQSLINCVPDPSGQGPPPGCNGGDPEMIHSYMYKTPVPDDSCLTWAGKNMGCTADTMCRNCLGTNCWAVPNYIGYGVSSYGTVTGEKDMMREIFARGPIVCSFATDKPWMFGYSANVVQHEGVYVTRQKKNASQIDHNMEVTGWGETPSGIKYWVIRNSWGTYWGEAGWAKIERGVNALMVESACSWAVPTWDGLDEALEGKTLGDYNVGVKPVNVGLTGSLGAVSKDSTLSTAVLGAFAAGITTALVVVKVDRRRRMGNQPFSLG